MATTNARIQFSTSTVEEWEKVNPKLREGEPVIAKKPNGKYILKVGAIGGSTYKDSVLAWDQDDAETKMNTSTTAAANAKASETAAKASQEAAKASETAAKNSQTATESSASAAASSAGAAKTSETNAANSASTATSKATAAANSATAAKTSESNAGKSATAASTSEANALKSANAASTSESNAKASETAAKASQDKVEQIEANVKAWDPSLYLKISDANTGFSTKTETVSEVTEANGKFTIKKADGKSSSFIVDLNLLLPKTAASHNSVYRGKDLTSYFNSGEMSKAIAAGTFDDIFPGDYIIKSVTINGTAFNDVKWLVADLDYHYDKGYKNQTAHHVILIPEDNLGTARMNATNTTAGGYQKSEMFKTTLPKYTTGIVAAFGTDHVLEHSELLTNNMNANAASAAGVGWMGSAYWDWGGKDGATDGSYPWRHDIKVNICNQAMMFGNHPFASSGQEDGDFNKQLAIFRYGKNFTRAYWCWLRDVAHALGFASANNGGIASTHNASNVGGVRPYFLLR